MKIVLGLMTAGLLVGVTGCEVGEGYGGVYGGVSGEYPSAYYGAGAYPDYVAPYPGYIYTVPYDRDHYWDHRYGWEHHHELREHHDRDWHRR
jgi:hypothetical protein